MKKIDDTFCGYIQVDNDTYTSFVKLRNNKTHSGTVEWRESAKIYAPLFAIIYVSFFKFIKLPDESNLHYYRSFRCKARKI